MTDCVYVLLALCGTYSVSPDTVNIFLCQNCFKPNQLSGAGVLFCTFCFFNNKTRSGLATDPTEQKQLCQMGERLDS